MANTKSVRKPAAKVLLEEGAVQGSEKNNPFRNSVSIVTGGASGIGRALCEKLCELGSEVVIADRQGDLAEKLAAELCAGNRMATAEEIDVSDYPAMKNLVEKTLQRTGRVNYMFNNAGVGISGNADDYDIDDWNYLVRINLNGVINGVQAVYKVMIRQGFGHIVNTASILGLIPTPGLVAYATTKHAVVGLSKSLRAEAARFGIRVSVLCPGVVDTPIWDGGGKFGRRRDDISPEAARRLVESLNPISPDVLADKALKAVAKNKAVIVEPTLWKRIWWINRISPSLGITLSQNNFLANLKTLG